MKPNKLKSKLLRRLNLFSLLEKAATTAWKTLFFSILRQNKKLFFFFLILYPLKRLLASDYIHKICLLFFFYGKQKKRRNENKKQRKKRKWQWHQPDYVSLNRIIITHKPFKIFWSARKARPAKNNVKKWYFMSWD